MACLSAPLYTLFSSFFNLKSSIFVLAQCIESFTILERVGNPFTIVFPYN